MNKVLYFFKMEIKIAGSVINSGSVRLVETQVNFFLGLID